MKYAFTILFLTFFLATFSQTTEQQKLSVFVEGRGIDFNYIRNNIDFVDFLNDSKSADVHVIISRKSTGGGGTEYTLSYYGEGFDKITDYSLSCFTFSFDTDMQRREKLTASLKAGLLPYLNEKGNLSNLRIESKESITKSDHANNLQTNDNWKNWVFRIGLEGGFSGEEQKKSFDYSISLEANKITDEWKIENEYDYDRRESKITNIEDGEEEIIETLRLDQDADVKFVYSLSKNWSWGIFLQGTQNTYRNNHMSLEAKPAIQYNFFPWSEVDRREFTITYFVGPSYNSYYETTILNKDKEWLWSENLEIRLEKVETWGDLEVFLEGGHYFPDFENYFYRAGFDVAFRISKGLSFTLEFQAESIHNQRYLPESELSIEDLLLNIRKPPTAFEYSGQIGIRYQFGSIYNNIVNQRLNN